MSMGARMTRSIVVAASSRAAGLVIALLISAWLFRAEGADDGDKLPVAYEGLHHVGKSELAAAARRELQDFQRHPTEAALADAAYSMEAVLREQGFAHGRVDFRLLPSQAEPKSAVFVIKEGARAYLQRLYFPGAAHFTQRRLRGMLKAQGIGLFDLQNAPYRKHDIDSCAGAVEMAYLLDGYYRVHVAKPVVSFSNDLRGAFAVVPIEEGKRFIITKVELDPDLTDSGMRVPDIKPVKEVAELIGKPYYVRSPSLAAAKIRAWLLDRGHLDTEVAAHAEIDDVTATVTVIFSIKPGPEYVLGEVLPVGLDRTKPGFVRRRLGLTHGKAIDRDRLDRGVRLLNRSGAFSSVRWEKRVQDPHGDSRVADVVLTLKEARARSLEFEAGFGSYELLRGGIRYRDRNLFGQGRYWEVHPTVSMKSYGGDSHLRDDYLVGANNVLDLGGGYLFRREPTFDRSTYTATISLEHRFDAKWSTKGGYTYETSRASNISAPLPGVEQSGYVSSARIFDGLRFDCRDSVVMPTTGVLASVGLAYSSPYVGSDLNFVEYSGGAAGFLSFGPRVVFGLDGRYTTRQVLDSAGTLPIQERLTLGGENSVRSYDQGELSPRDTAGHATGGLTAAMASAELRLQMRGHFWTAVFYDIGEVDEETWHLDGTVGQGIGTGIRYQLPVGPVRLDVAYDPKRKARDFGAYLFLFAVGFSF